MKTAIVIPARYASTRLPGKPLLRQTGKYLVQHVYERACLAQSADRVVVATDDPPDFAARPPAFLHHLGLYAYRRPFLLALASLPPEPLEESEKLEQLRVLAVGRRIYVGVVQHAAVGVDTRDDYDRFVAAYRQ